MSRLAAKVPSPSHAAREGEAAQPLMGLYFNQPRLRKYSMGPSALATMRATT